MNSSLLLSAATFIYALASVFYIGSFSFKKPAFARLGFWVIVIGLVANTGGILLRWMESYHMGYGHAPFSNMYESLVFFSWTTAALYVFVEFKYKESIIGVFVSPLIFLSIAYASFDPSITSKITPLIPALKSNWLIAHVITCFLGYAGFALAFGFSFMYFIKPKDPGASSFFAKLPDWDTIDELTYQMIVFGFLFLTIGIITGSVWANSAWGKYWSWDPKETWSLITWFIYAIFLHLRLMRGWYGKNLAIVSIIGFLGVLFTYFGVNFLLSGLHSYG
ncbi:MAG TPA: c-type cytochrome biogenesis protein CcsB [Desulfobacter postgatei]|jgi:cytochrome c-type biogenesis protein CcsB|uniref:c-type cytochrome biogenesis protein CcsB n=1 Tax=Desulfobacter sp. TaxID=2294 RepID=UPI000E9742A1|nr:c-type cytochrome biogenesis protein CcsB [Desulfobacter sp.]MBP8829071.1 c-type cytochrome biogenesis protein CcsB [Desulfobacter sp.]MBP9598414.1 c-type cytochrome biogenesis protein CcsB [Desulfobacter sp.]HBT89937.1 c-type cytochrome biogenesis protein CcsB [Desulfobacter sp.]HRF90921.1 c-type cytochrome biogenesis protein CcsB [Desulfobacter postgatei]